MTEKTFANGVFAKTKETQYGNIYKLSFVVEDFIKFLQDNKNDKGWVNVDMKEAQSGKLYFELDNWKPDNASTGGNIATPKGSDDEDLPF